MENNTVKNPVILIEYPSGKQETWKPNIVSIPVNKLQEKHDIKDIYQLSPYSFKESGEITLTIKENNVKTIQFPFNKINKNCSSILLKEQFYLFYSIIYLM